MQNIEELIKHCPAANNIYQSAPLPQSDQLTKQMVISGAHFDKMRQIVATATGSPVGINLRFDYTGSTQEFTIPTDEKYYLTVTGGSGGKGKNGNRVSDTIDHNMFPFLFGGGLGGDGGNGGKGSSITGCLYLTSGTQLTINIGKQGEVGNPGESSNIQQNTTTYLESSGGGAGGNGGNGGNGTSVSYPGGTPGSNGYNAGALGYHIDNGRYGAKGKGRNYSHPDVTEVSVTLDHNNGNGYVEISW